MAVCGLDININSQDYDGRAGIHIAAANGNLEMIFLFKSSMNYISVVN